MDEKIRSQTWVVWVVIGGLTAAYLVALLWLVVHSSPCPPPDDGTALRDYPLASMVSCRTTNEIGDFLAGAFAPLAFLWLAGAVFIQSRELAMQRLELIDTRAVMREQTAESRATKEFIGTQTAILQAQEAERLQLLKDSMFDSYLLSLFAGASQPGGFYLRGEMRQFDDWVYWAWTLVDADDREKTSDKVLFELADRLDRVADDLRNDETYRLTEASVAATAGLALLADGIATARSMIIGLSEPRGIMAKALPFERIEGRLRSLLGTISAVSNRQIANALLTPAANTTQAHP